MVEFLSYCFDSYHVRPGGGDDLDRYHAGRRLGKRRRFNRKTGVPGDLIDDGTELLLERFDLSVGFGSREVKASGKEADPVVFGVDHPAGDVARISGTKVA